MLWPGRPTIDVHLHHDHGLHGLVGDPDHPGAPLTRAPGHLVGGGVRLGGRSLAGALLLRLAGGVRRLCLPFCGGASVRRHGHGGPQVDLGQSRSHTCLKRVP